MSIATKFLRLIWRGWCTRARQIFYTYSRNVLKCSDFIFYVATIKSNTFNANLRFWHKYRSILEACRRARAACTPKIFQKNLPLGAYLKIYKFSFSQKHISEALKIPLKISAGMCYDITFPNQMFFLRKNFRGYWVFFAKIVEEEIFIPKTALVSSR